MSRVYHRAKEFQCRNRSCPDRAPKVFLTSRGLKDEARAERGRDVRRKSFSFFFSPRILYERAPLLDSPPCAYAYLRGNRLADGEKEKEKKEKERKGQPGDSDECFFACVRRRSGCSGLT